MNALSLCLHAGAQVCRCTSVHAWLSVCAHPCLGYMWDVDSCVGAGGVHTMDWGASVCVSLPDGALGLSSPAPSHTCPQLPAGGS